jgi:hypothetical protein
VGMIDLAPTRGRDTEEPRAAAPPGRTASVATAIAMNVTLARIERRQSLVPDAIAQGGEPRIDLSR